MGKKVELRKIENPTKCQVTFSKQRTGLLKKVRETSGSCDVDVALLTFSPSGCISKFCNRNRTEDVLGRYNNLPAEKRYPQIKNTEEKVEKLKLFDHIQGDENKLHFLNNQIKQMEQRIRKATLESDLLDTCLSDYEPDPSRDTSLAQLLWCERKLKHSLQRVTERKRMLLANLPPSNEQLRIEKKQKEMERMLANLASSSEQLKILQKEQKEMERMLLANLASSKEQLRVQKEMERKALSANIAHDLGGNEVDWGTPHPYATNLLMQLDPWLSPHRPKVRQALLQELSSQQKRELVAVDDAVKLFNYTKHAPTQGRFAHDVPLVTQPQQIPAQTMTQNRNHPTGYNGNIAPMSRLYGNGTNYHLNSSISGNYNTNLNNWNQNSTANNMINSSIGGNNYKTIIDTWNQDSIANINAPIISSERVQM